MPGSGNRVEEMQRAGLAAAVALAGEQGLPTADPRIMSNRGNLLVHLAPAPVVARVATLTAWTRSDPFPWLAREVAVAAHAARNGGPVVAPTALADPGPHWSRGLAVSLWTWVPPSRARPGPADVGEALAQLHLAAAGFAGELPFLSPIRAQITDGLAALERERVLDPATLTALRDRHADVLADLPGGAGAPLVLHGDAHAGNLLDDAAEGWLWIDLEETCRGPREFDLAVLVGSQAEHGAAAVAAYAAVTGEPAPDPEALAPFSRARELEAAVWALGMAHQYPARYAETARTLLGRILGNGTSAR